MQLRLLAALAVAAAALALAAPAQADLAYKTGPEINTSQGNCFPLTAYASYTQQTNGNTPVEPRVDDVFWIAVDYSFFQTFDCAADFVSAEVTLPPGVTPVTGPGAPEPICRRIGGQSPNFVHDPRATNACPDAVDFNAGTRKFGIRPKAGSPEPDFPVSGRWFIGQRAPQENVLYHYLQLLVPVRATQTMTNQPIGLLVCSVGTSCATGGVNLTVNPAPGAAEPPRISFAGDAETSAVGVRVPFSINSPDSNPGYGIKTDISERADFNGQRPCGLTGPEIFPEDETQEYVGDQDDGVILYGDLDDIAPNPCRLEPGTTYHLEACTVYFTGPTTYNEQHCQTTSFRTNAVATRFTPPAGGDVGTNSMTVRRHQVLSGRPAGVLSLRYRVKGSGAGYTVGPTQSMPASLSGSGPVDRVVNGLTPGTTYELVSCFQVTGGALFCGDPVDVRTAGSPPGPPPPPGGGGAPGGGGPPGGGGGGGGADTTDPTASVRVRGKVKRGRRVTLTVAASDASGVRSVTIKVGKGKPRNARRVTIKLPRRKGRVRVVITVTDNAGNVTTITRTLRVR